MPGLMIVDYLRLEILAMLSAPFLPLVALWLLARVCLTSYSDARPAKAEVSAFVYQSRCIAHGNATWEKAE